MTLLSLLLCMLACDLEQPDRPVYPGKTWDTRAPEQVGLTQTPLDALRALVGGHGCVVRHGFLVYTWGDVSRSGDIASAVKPIISTLLMMAIQEGRLKSVDDLVADFEPRLRTLNGGKHKDMTWRHLASQTSGYGLAEAPGKAYAYNDYALALYYDTLTQKVFKEDGTRVLKERLADVLRFEDKYTFEAFGKKDRPGRLAVSVRDLARFGLLTLRGGRWDGKQVLRPDLLRLAVGSPLDAGTPLTSGKELPMLPGQRTLGGGKNITPTGPGFYSFNWWLNTTDQKGRRLFADLPPDTYVAAGHGGKRMLWIIPSLDLIVCWNDAKIDDFDRSPADPKTVCNQAARLIRDAVLDGKGKDGGTRLGVKGTQFTINGRPTFLLGISYYGALGAPEKFIRRDLQEIKKRGFNWIRVWATWAAFDHDVSAVDAEGKPRKSYLEKLKGLVAECDRLGLVVDVTLSRGNAVTGPARLQTLEAHRRAVETLVAALRPYRNWYLDLSNERSLKDKRFTGIEDLKELRAVVRKLDPDRLVTASHVGDPGKEDLIAYLREAKLDFVSPHRARNAKSPAATKGAAQKTLALMAELKLTAPLHYQEPFRRGFGKYQPVAADYATDLRGAIEGGAAGWCFHNGDDRGDPKGRRRSFDMRKQRLFEQLDEEEREALKLIERVVKPRGESSSPAGE
jgi:CubicO group peptidase (beta-lactamase class C family)